MIITYHGAEFFKVQFGETILAFNPISKESKLKATRFGADIALISINHKDMNGADQLSFGDRELFIVNGPGEYEIKGVFVKGYPSESAYGGKVISNTIYAVSLEGMSLCFLGAIQSGAKISADIQETLEGIDVLFVPIGGEGVLTAGDAYKLAVKLEPKIVIPMHFNLNGDKNSLKTFLKEAGEEVDSVEKFTFKKKDLEGKEVDVVVISES